MYDLENAIQPVAPAAMAPTTAIVQTQLDGSDRRTGKSEQEDANLRANITKNAS